MASNRESPDKQTQGTTKKLRSACDTCHQTKVRCSGGNPCQMCQHLEAECIYSPSSRKGRPKGTRPRKSLQQETLSGGQVTSGNSTPANKHSVRAKPRKQDIADASHGILSPDTESYLFENDIDDLIFPDGIQEMLSSATSTSYSRSIGSHMNDGFNSPLQENLPYDMASFFDTASLQSSETWCQPYPTHTIDPHGSFPNQYSDNLGNWNNIGAVASFPQRRVSLVNSIPENHLGTFGSHGPYATAISTINASNMPVEGGINSAKVDDGQDCLQRHTACFFHQLGQVRSITTPRIDVLLICAREISTASFSLLRCAKCQNKDIQEVFIIIIAVLRLFVRKLQFSDEKSSSPSIEGSSNESSNPGTEQMMIDDDIDHIEPVAINTPESLGHSSFQSPSRQLISSMTMQSDSIPISLGDYPTTKSEQMLITDVLRKRMLQRLGEVITALKRRIQISPSASPSSFKGTMHKDINTQNICTDGDSGNRIDGGGFGDLAHFLGILQSLETVVHRLAG
ncbi:hypothetical protein BGW36DRAFT_430104 [Talaromyces proteolyticus]|uniref:Zn(2)-C6 fungal-type domain-containing protein n=1 Tax=Talaromyces proteolyticus TaxID=1131652 RepID=A0AAD4KQW3_9EURO|nr:uncharacterized protein BGW36DRAFT_430104 [Talaromyces proteolyticus]KAH8694079.1 hypothetical protein BGW36DRAFT_430104 [Talaromyces proteolyticus]